MSPTGQMRVAIPPIQRLATIAETVNPPATPPTPPIPRKSSRRKSALDSASSATGSPRRWSGSQDTIKTGPPPYDWVLEPAEPLDSSHGEKSIAEESQKEVESGGNELGQQSWRGSRAARFALVVGVILVVVLGLVIGLGVGLSRNNNSSKSASQSPPTSPNGLQQFPLGRYSLVTTLIDSQTSCTSNPATWRCNTSNTSTLSSNSTNGSDLVTFNWMISNTSTTYATHKSMPSTPDSGVPANLTISSITDTFGISFSNKSLTYIASSSNSSSSRYSFSFTVPKMVIPYPSIAPSNTTAKCFFNETVFSGSIYLSAAANDHLHDAIDSKTRSAFEQWPHAVEITQSAAGGTNVPNCYEIVDGATTEPIDTGSIPQPRGSECLCDYRNYN